MGNDIKPGIKKLPLVLSGSLLLAVFSQQATSVGLHDGLLQALRFGDDQAIREQLADIPDPDRILPDGSTLLGWAVDGQNSEAVRLLLEAGADPNAGINTAAAPLLLACELGDGNPLIPDLLLDANADVNVRRPDGISALAICSGRAPIEIVQRMIDLGAEVEEADALGQTPLMWAAAAGRTDVIDLLISRGAQVNRETAKGFTPLFFSLKSGNPMATTALLNAGADPGHRASDDTSAVQLAMYQRAHDFVALMLERGGVDLTAFDQNGNQLLHAAVLAQHAELVKLLIAAGADVNTETVPSKVQWRYERNYRADDYIVAMKSPLLLAAELGAVGIMDILLEAGADAEYITSEGVNIVLAATASGSAQTLARALQVSPDANVTDHNGQTPLHVLLSLASGNDESFSQINEMMSMLAAHGSRPDIPDNSGLTALDIVVSEPASSPLHRSFTTIFNLAGAPSVSL